MGKSYLCCVWIFLLGCLGVPLTAHATKSFKILDNNNTKILSPSGTSVYAGEGNVVKGLTFQLSIQNTGDEDLTPGDEGYSVTLHFRYSNIDLCTENIPETIPAGETKEVTIVWGGDQGVSLAPAAEYFKDGKIYVSNSFSVGLSVRENMNNADLWRVPPFVTVYLDSAEYELLPETGTSAIKWNTGFGYVSDEPVTNKFRIHASASRDVKINSITFPDGFSTTQTFPVTVMGGVNATDPQDQYLELPVTFNPSAPGVYGGKMIVNADGMDPKEFHLSGGKKGGEYYFMGFENEEMDKESKTIPGWILGDNFRRSLKNYNFITETDSVMLEHSRSGVDYITKAVTPLLSFREGERLLFEARCNTSYGAGSPVVKVLYSTDRVNWTETGTAIYTNNTSMGNEGATDLFNTSSPYPFQQYMSVMPEGKYYVAFEMGNSSLDNVFGGKLMDVDYDLYLENVSAPESMMVNKAGYFTMNAKNVSATKGVSQDDYDVALYVDGKKAAQAETVEWGPNTSLQFDMAYVPHQAGEVKAYVMLKAGDLELKSEEFAIPVAEETLVASATVGTPKAMSSANSKAPFNFYYNNSSSDIVFPEDYLVKYGITPGTVIEGMSIEGYSQSAKTLTAELSVKMKGVDVSTVRKDDEVFDLSDVAPIYSATAIELPGGSMSNTSKVIDFTFTSPYVYEGGNLLMHCASENQSTYVNTYYVWTDELAENVRVKAKDNHNQYLTASYDNFNYVPVITFALKVEPSTLSGTVTHGEEPVADAVVTIYGSDDVIYSATTDAEGKYSMTVFQAEKTYDMTVSAPGYVMYKSHEPISFADGSVVADVVLNTYMNISGHVVNGRGENIEGAVVTFSSGEYTASSITDAEGGYAIKAYEFGGTAVMSLDAADYYYQTKDLDLSVPYDRIVDFEGVPFTNAREFKLKVNVDAVVDEIDMSGVPFTLKSVRFNETYPQSETVLGEKGVCEIAVYGGAHTMTIKTVGTEEKTVSFNVNRDTEVNVLLGEDVQNPRDIRTVIVHDALTGKNDLLVTWNPDAAAAKPVRRVMKRSAANPYESFIITMDGVKVGETEAYEYLIENVSGGSHLVTVMSKYATTQSEATASSVELTNDGYVPVAFTLTNNADADLDGAAINLHGDLDYAVTVENGRAMLGYLPRGKYSVSIDVKGFEPYSADVEFNAPSFLDINLSEVISRPYNLSVDCAENADGSGFEVHAAWNQIWGMTDSFEDYDDFSTGFGDWKTLDLNTEPSYPMMFGNKLVTFPGSSTVSAPASVAPMVFNPAGTTPSLAGEASVSAFAGEKYVIFQGPQAATADKWLISPEMEIRAGFSWTLAAKAYTNYPETLQLCVSEAGDAPADFKVVKTISPASDAWNTYSVDLAEYAGKRIRVAVHCTSADGFMAMVDDFKVSDPEGDVVADMSRVKNYELTLGDIKATTEKTNHTFSNVPAGSYTLGVKAVYASGISEEVTYLLNMVSGIDAALADGVKGDVVTPTGVIVLRDASASDIRTLDKGIYIFAGRKVVVK